VFEQIFSVILNTATYCNAEQRIPSLHLFTLCETGPAHVFMFIGVKNVTNIRNMPTNNQIHTSYNRTEIVSSYTSAENAINYFLKFTKGYISAVKCVSSLHTAITWWSMPNGDQ